MEQTVAEKRCLELVEKAQTYEVRIQRVEKEIEGLREALTLAKGAGSQHVPLIEAEIERLRLKVVDLKERYDRVRDWLANPEKDQRFQTPPKPSGQVVNPEGIASKEAHPAS